MRELLQRCLRAVSLALPLTFLCSAAAADEPVCPPKASMPSEQELQALVQGAQNRGLLWRISHNGRSSWLYGTVHVAKREWMVPGRAVIGALQRSDKLALEINLLDPEVGQALVSGLKARDDAPALDAALSARLALQRQQACADDLARLRPDAQVMSLLALAGRVQGLDPSYGVDLTLAGMALGMGKPVAALESAQTQLRELISDDPATVAKNVEDGLRQLEGGKAAAMVAQLTGIWADGDQEKLERYADWCDCANTPSERAQLKRMLDDRNPGMADGIARMLEEGSTVFAAVGALHMIGPQGLPTLLRAKGYRVERIRLKPRTPQE